jgi:transcriptional regulator with XRE-family HTH domain
MSFGQVIKRLRRNADMTQEQLAEMLSVSPQAVSRWETDTAMPDISFLRPLSTIFGVTSDVLLEIDVARVNEQVHAYVQEILQLRLNKAYEEMLSLARKAYKEIPTDLKLASMLAYALRTGKNGESEENIDEAISLLKLILEKSLDNTLRFRATSALCRIYATKKNNKEQALFYANQLPEHHQLSAPYMIAQYNLMPEEKKTETYRRLIVQYARATVDAMYALADPDFEDQENDLSVAQRIEIMEMQLEILRLVYGEQLLAVNIDFYNIKRIIGCLYLLNGEQERALDYYEEAAEHAIAFDTYCEDASYTSLIAGGLRTLERIWWGLSATENFLERLTTQPRYEVLKENTRYQKILKMLQDSVAAK